MPRRCVSQPTSHTFSRDLCQVWKDLRINTHKIALNLAESSPFTTLPTKLRRLWTFATIYCNHLTGSCCFRIYFKHRILITAAPQLSTLIAYLLVQVKISLIRVQINIPWHRKCFTWYEGAVLIILC